MREELEIPPMSESADAPVPVNPKAASGTDRWKERGVRIRVLLYVVGAHLLAALLWLFFVIGAHAHK